MSKARIVITDTTGAESVWEETSPKDPTRVTVHPFGSQEIRSKADNGPWTVSLVTVTGRTTPPTEVVLPENPAGTSAGIVLCDGTAGLFTVDVPQE